MKVLEVIGVLNRGGAETLLVNILEKINKREFEIDFLVYENKEFDYSEKVKKLGANIIFIESPNDIGMINFIKKLKTLIKDNGYEVVHAHTLFNCGPVMLAAFLAGVKKRFSHSHNTKILEENITFKKKIYFLISKFLLNFFSTVCLSCGEEAGKFLFYNFRKYIIIKNGIDLEKYKFNDCLNKKIRQKYNISNNSIIVGNVGRLNFQKNQMFLIDVFNEFQKKNKDSYLFIVGDGELENSLKNKVRYYKIEQKVIFTGSIPNVNEYYSAFDLFLFPSLFEGLPYTLIEAQANGLPILASNKISEEVNISKKINFYDLDLSASEWADKLELCMNESRFNNVESIIDNGYSIDNTTELVESFYKYGRKRK